MAANRQRVATPCPQSCPRVLVLALGLALSPAGSEARAQADPRPNDGGMPAVLTSEDRAKVERLLQQSTAAAALIQDGEQRMEVLEAIAETTARAGDRNRAAEIVRLMVRSSETPRRGRDAVFRLTRLANLQARFGNREDARATFARVRSIIQSIDDPNDKYWAWWDQVRELIRLGDVAAARRAIREAKFLEEEPLASSDVFGPSRAAEFQAQLGDFDDAFKTLSRLTRENGGAIDRFPECLGKSLRGKDRATIRRVLTECRRLHKPAPKRDPEDVVTPRPGSSVEESLILNTGKAYATLGCMPEALEIVEELGQRAANAPADDSGQREARHSRLKQIELLVVIAEAQAKGNDVDTALATLQSVLKLSENLKDDDPNKSRELVAEVLARMGRFDEALRVARTIVEAQVEQPDPLIRRFVPPRGSRYWSYRADAIMAIAEAQARGGDQEAARKTLREELAPLENAMQAQDWESLSRKRAFAQLEAGNLEAARESFRQSIRYNEGRYFDPIAYQQFAKKQAAAGDIEGAIETAGKMRGPTVLPAFRGQLLLELAVMQAERGDEPGARRTIESIPKEAPVKTMMAHAGIAEVRAKAGDVAGATAWANGLQPASFKAAALQGVAEGIVSRTLGEPPPEGMR